MLKKLLISVTCLISCASYAMELQQWVKEANSVEVQYAKAGGGSTSVSISEDTTIRDIRNCLNCFALEKIKVREGWFFLATSS